jgi:formate dehydrogenase subunit delta
MKIEALVKMANEIAAFFEGEGGEKEGPPLMASHLQRFWEPRMRRQIVAHYREGGEGLDEFARRAVALLAENTPAEPPGQTAQAR